MFLTFSFPDTDQKYQLVMAQAQAQYSGVRWDQRPDYLALAQRVDPAGIVTAYSKSRKYQVESVADSS